MKDIVLAAYGVCCAESGAEAPVLDGIDLEAAEGQVTAILCTDDAGKDALIKVLSFQAPPLSGEVRFQGRVVGRQGPCELQGMRQKALVLENPDLTRMADAQAIPEPWPCIILANVTPTKNRTAVPKLASFLKELASHRAAVVIVTSDPSMALWADTVYRLSGGKTQKMLC